MKLTVFLNNGKITEMPCPGFDQGTLHTLARQMSRCDLVHTVRAREYDEDLGLDYRDGWTTEGA